MTVRAPAKINLYLEVIRRRASGYHDIRSVLVPISVFDVVTLEKTRGRIETTVRTRGLARGNGLNLASPDDNLATKAALALKKATGYRGGAMIHIEKNIPVGGGLGGGSSDAAAVLTGLNALWKTGVPLKKLIRIGAAVGCDIPALINGGAVRVGGLGEKVSPVRAANGRDGGGWWLVVANPGFSVSTRDIYERYKPSLTSRPAAIRSTLSALKKGNVRLAVKGLFNSLQETVFRKYPLIEMLAERLEKAGAAGVLLCGSGASVFGLARNREHARRIAGRVGRNPGFPAWSRIARTLPDGVMAAHGPLEA